MPYVAARPSNHKVKGIYTYCREFYDERSKVEGRRSKVEGRRSKVEGRRSKVEGRRSKVEGRRSKVEGRRSKVEGRRSKVEGRVKGCAPRDQASGADGRRSLLLPVCPATNSEPHRQPHLFAEGESLRDSGLGAAVDADEKADRREAEDQAGAAVADERKWKAVVR